MARAEIEIPEDVSAEVDHLDLTVEGPNGTVSRRLWYPSVTVRVDDVETDDGGEAQSASDESSDDEPRETVAAVVVESDEDDAETRSTVGTFESHIRNMFHGVTEGWEYKMEVFYAHFPMQVAVEGDEIVINNFLGERAPRRTPVRGDTEIDVDGEELTLRGPDKEAVGQTAADIEQLTRVRGKDTRVFQDGVYIVEKPQKAGGA